MKIVIQVLLAIVIAYFGSQLFSLLCLKYLPQSEAYIPSLLFAIILGLNANSIAGKILSVFSLED